MVHASLAWWQESHLRPLVPRLLKKGLSVSTSPLGVNVWILPVGVANGLRRSPPSSSESCNPKALCELNASSCESGGAAPQAQNTNSAVNAIDGEKFLKT